MVLQSFLFFESWKNRGAFEICTFQLFRFKSSLLFREQVKNLREKKLAVGALTAWCSNAAVSGFVESTASRSTNRTDARSIKRRACGKHIEGATYSTKNLGLRIVFGGCRLPAPASRMSIDWQWQGGQFAYTVSWASSVAMDTWARNKVHSNFFRDASKLTYAFNYTHAFYSIYRN